MALTLSTNEFATGALGLVEHATGNPIVATFANVTGTSADSTIFTVAPNTTDATSIDVTGVAVGTANLTVTATVTYVDPATSQSVSVSKTAIISVTITQGTTAADLVVNFGVPQQKP